MPSAATGTRPAPSQARSKLLTELGKVRAHLTKEEQEGLATMGLERLGIVRARVAQAFIDKLLPHSGVKPERHDALSVCLRRCDLSQLRQMAHNRRIPSDIVASFA